MTKIDIECYAIGKTSAHVVTDEEQRIIASSNVNLQNSTNVQQFNRMMMKNTIYYSKQYSRSRCRNNTICCYLSDDNSIQYGTIITFYLAQETQPFCFIEKLHAANDSSPLMNIRPSHNRNIRDLISQQVVHTTKYPSEIIALSIKQIFKKCIFISVPHDIGRAEYVITLPNSYEIH